MSKAVVLLSAGLDSVVSFKLAYDAYDEITCLTFDYAQKARSIEIEYASRICAMYSVSHQIIKLPWYASFAGALTNERGPPQLTHAALDNFAMTHETARAVWVPARNIVFLSIAAAFCENYDFKTVIVGFNKEEAKTFPDNTIDFVASLNQALKYATLNEVEVFAPLLEYEKAAIAELGLRIGAPLEWSWSCYLAEETPCAACESCLRRSSAFKAIRKEDPLIKRLKSRVNGPRNGSQSQHFRGV